MRLTKFFMLSVLTVFALVAGAAAQNTDWKGFYVGAHVGFSAGHSDATTSTVFSPTGYFATTSVPAIATAGAQSLDDNAFTGGGQVGYNWRSGNFVLGGEVDLSAFRQGVKGGAHAVYPCCPPTAFTVSQSVTTTWLFTARPRVGYASGNWLVYGTGGMAVTNPNYQAVFNDSFATAHENGGVDETRIGWVAGGGLEYKIAQHVSLKGEYLYGSFGSATTTSTNLTAFTPPIAFPTNVFTHHADLTAHIVRFGFNYHF